MDFPAFRLERFLAQYEFTAPYLMCCSDCQSFTVREILDLEPETAHKLEDLWLGYTEAAGSLSLRKSISSLYSTISADRVLVYNGAEEAIFSFMHTMLKEKDHIIVQWPCYQSLYEVAAGIAGKITRWKARKTKEWSLNIRSLKRQIRPNTRAVIINSPHNPTGYVIPKSLLVRLSQMARKHGFLIFSDEVYRFLEYPANHRPPSMCDLSENAVSLGVMSKSFGLPGLRIGWIATQNQMVLDRMAIFKDYTTICNSAPSEFLATLALRHKDVLLKRNRAIISHNLTILNRFFQKYKSIFHWQPPRGGPVGFPSLKNNKDATEFCMKLKNDVGVLLLPGMLYDPAYKSHFRIGFGRKNFPECLDVLDRYLKFENQAKQSDFS